MLAHGSVRVSRAPAPSALDPDAMLAANPAFFGFGEADLPDDLRFPSTSAFARLHKEVCESPPGRESACGGCVAGLILRRGWRVPFASRPTSSVRGAAAYGGEASKEAVTSEFVKLLEVGAIRLLPAGVRAEAFVPFAAVLKDAAYHQAAAACGRSVADLERAGVDFTLAAMAAAGLDPPKVRLVSNFRYQAWNDHLPRYRFSLPPVGAAVDLIAGLKDPHFGVVDLRRFFLCIRTTEGSWPAMCVRDPRSSAGPAFCYCTAAFGTAASPAVAAFISGNIVELARRRFGLRACVYLDDILFAADGREAALEHERQLLELLRELRFEVAEEKRVPVTTAARYLGFDLDLVGVPGEDAPLVRIGLPRDRLERAALKVSTALQSPTSSFSDWMSLCGTLLSLSEVIDGGWRETLPLYVDRAGRTARQRSRQIRVSDRDSAHLRWWRDTLADALVRPPSQLATKKLSFNELESAPLLLTDASGDPDKGFGGHTEDLSVEWSVPWEDLPEGTRHPTNMVANELAPIVYALENVPLAPDRLIICATDNVGAALALCGGASRCPTATEWLRRVECRARALRAKVAGVWVPREINSRADALAALPAGLTPPPSTS
jgi:hypothetical protein